MPAEAETNPVYRTLPLTPVFGGVVLLAPSSVHFVALGVGVVVRRLSFGARSMSRQQS